MRRRWLRWTAALTALAVAGASAWYVAELTRPAPTTRPDTARYERSAPGVRTVPLPLTVEVLPLTRLAIVPLTAGSDTLYTAFEPQWIDRGSERGHRIVAYRTDGFVDLYDDPALTIDPSEGSPLTGKGSRHHVHADLSSTRLEWDAQGRVRITFAFTDVTGRAISAELIERTGWPSHPTTLLAPVGMSSEHPAYLPFFVLDAFDFVRAGNGVVDVTIDGRPVEVEPFPAPIPLQGQPRTFARHAMATHALALFPTTATLTSVTLDGTDAHAVDGIRYLFAGQALESVLVSDIEVSFTPPLDLASSGTGSWQVRAFPDRGTLGGDYRVAASGTTSRLELGVSRSVVPHQRDPLYRLFINDASAFGTWPLAYRFEATYDTAAGTVASRWVNDRPGG